MSVIRLVISAKRLASLVSFCLGVAAMKHIRLFAGYLGVVQLLFLSILGTANAETQFDGNYRIKAWNSEDGSLSLEGGLGVEGNGDFGGAIKLGSTQEDPAYSAVRISYDEAGLGNMVSFEARRGDAIFRFSENGGVAAREKLRLDSDNSMLLYDKAGALGVKVSPNSGILLGQGRSITLGDGTVLSGASSLRGSILYDGMGVSTVSVDGQGRVAVGVPTASARLSVKGSGTDNIADFYMPSGASAASFQSNGGLAIGTSANIGNSRLVLKGVTSDTGAYLFEMLSSSGTRVASFDHGGTLRLNGLIFQTNPYNARVLTFYSGDGSIDLNDTLHLNRSSVSGVVLAYGGGRVGVGTYAASARLEVFNKGSGADAVLRVVGAANQAGNLLEVQTQAGARKMVVTANGNVGIGADNPTAKLDISGKCIVRDELEVNGAIKMNRQGDIMMGEFGNPE